MANLAEANKLFRNRDYLAASRAYARLIEGTWDFYVYHENLAASEQALGKHAESLEYFSTALMLNRDSERAYSAIKLSSLKKQEQAPALSIIVPVHNTQKYLSRCLESILSQTLSDFELIVINDGSTDQSGNIIEGLASKDARIVSISNRAPSGNPGTPRNQGIELARGYYIGFVDSDDWIEPDYFATLLDAARQQDADVAFAGGFKNHKNDVATARRYAKTDFNNRTSPLYKYHESFMIWDKIYRASLIKRLGIRLGETRAAVDVPFILKAYYYLRNAAFCDDLLGYNYRRESETSVTVKHRKSSNCNFEFEAYKAVDDWASQYQISPQYRKIIDFRKLNSYLYTLSVIDPKMREPFAEEARRQLTQVRRDDIASLAKLSKREHILEKLDSVLAPKLNSAKLVSESKRPVAKEVKKGEPTRKNEGPPPFSFSIEGERSGILFFPDWSHANPYQKLLYGALSERYGIRIGGLSQKHLKKSVLKDCREKFSIIHVHWLHALMDFSSDSGANAFMDALQYAKSIGYQIVYTAHNIISHDTEFRERELRFRKKASTLFDYILTHGNLAKERIEKEIGVPSEKVHIVPHGTYEGYYPNYVSPEFARSKLGIPESDFVFLFFGNIKAYKGIDKLLEAYVSVKRKYRNVRLVIAGRAMEKDSENLIQNLCASDDSVLYKPEYIGDQYVQEYFNAANIVVLPYRNILTSGAMLLSMAFHKPVIAPRAGLIPELISDGRQGYLFDNYPQMAAIMEDCASAFISGRWAERHSTFEFASTNEDLRWTRIAASAPFPEIFGRSPRDIIAPKTKPYDYCILRILGNDLPFRHESGQTIRNLTFTLKNETDFVATKKIWVLNRIIDAEKKAKLIELLKLHGKDFVDIPYEAGELAKIPYAFEELPVEDIKLTKEYDALDERAKVIVDTAILRHKNRYLMNNNGARNAALAEGRKHARWVFPWDGNCFINDDAWAQLVKSLSNRPDLKYHIVPMDRVLQNELLLDKGYRPNPSEEPQIIFRDDAPLSFDEGLVYGLKPKVDLLKRLGVPGVWNGWKQLYPWKPHITAHQPGAFVYGWAGWVARLFSGHKEQETDLFARGVSREKGMVALLQETDRKDLFSSFKSSSLAFYDEKALCAMRANFAAGSKGEYSNVLTALESSAKQFLKNPLYTVVSKTTLPPSGDVRDYWHPAPYFWPNPASPNGLPYLYKDGERVPGTRMYEPESVKYDRTSIQKLFDETTALAIYGFISQDERFTEKAYKLIKCWFLDSRTAMNPHLTYSQVVMGRNDSKGTASGLIETKDFYYFLDAVRLIKRSPYWTLGDDKGMNKWCSDFLSWLNESEQGQAECRTKNNHGIAYDLQTYAFSAFLGDTKQMYNILVRSLSRLKSHVMEDGSQPHEMKRTTTAHYTAFNLHLWLNFHQMVRRTSSFSVASYKHRYKGGDKSPLKLATSWVLSFVGKTWPFEQIDEFDGERYQHIYHGIAQLSPSIRDKYGSAIPPLSSSKSVFFPHDGIAPYWALSMT